MTLGSLTMRALKGAVPIATSLALIMAVTAILWQMKLSAAHASALIYLYLVPLVLISGLYNGRTAILCTAVAMVCANYFLQEPMYSFSVDNRLDYGDLFCFALLAAITIKCVRVLMRPRAKSVDARSRHWRR
jgi:K+-sensing histidine kinase KdpD